MRTRVLLVVIFMFTIISGFSQSSYKNGIFLEGAGNGYIGSLNYERQFLSRTTGRIGLLLLPKLIVVPVTYGKVFGQQEHHFEIAGGFDFVRNGNNLNLQEFIYLTGFVGYRYQKPDKRPFFRGGFVPFISLFDNLEGDGVGTFYPWFGISGGVRF